MLDSKVTIQLKPGDVVRYETPGGGGYGRALERDPLLVLRDVRDGKVSHERAASAYGVVIDATGATIDEQATADLRFARTSTDRDAR